MINKGLKDYLGVKSPSEEYDAVEAGKRVAAGWSAGIGVVYKERMEAIVNILGTDYKIIIADEEEKPKLKKADGYMDQSIKEIVVGKFDDDDPMNIADLKSYTKKVLRHEIIHAFLYESGIWNNSGDVEAWGKSEEITDWIAIQFPKMIKAFEEVGAL